LSRMCRVTNTTTVRDC